MAKKNEFIFNIGFNRENPDHVKVAGILNRLGHGKAEYLAKAVLAYESQGMEPMETSVGIDYRELEEIVLGIIAKQSRNLDSAETKNSQKKIDSSDSSMEEKYIDEEDLKGIFMALEGFKG